MAETYHIYDIRALRPLLVARLLFGLRDDSRLKMAMSGTRYSVKELMLAQCVDALNLLWWSNTVDGKSNKNRPQSIMAILVGKEKEKTCNSYQTAEEWERAREELMRKVGGGNG